MESDIITQDINDKLYNFTQHKSLHRQCVKWQCYVTATVKKSKYNIKETQCTTCITLQSYNKHNALNICRATS